MTLEEVQVCPVCGSQSFRPHLTVKDVTASQESFHLRKCESCSLLMTSPRPGKDQITRYYQSPDYISHTGGGEGLVDRAYRLVRRITLRQKKALVQRFHGPGALLDYGCGTGEFLQVCQRGGWETIGVEPSLPARQRVPPEITTYPDLDGVSSPVDVITLWHVLEHVHDLTGTLNALHALLKKGGTIFIGVPNSDSFDAMHYKEHWAAYDVPRHLWHFNKKSMTKLLARMNLEIAAILPMKLDAFYVSILSEHHKNPGSLSLIQWLRSSYVGLRSNLKAGPDNYSSLIYVAGS